MTLDQLAALLDQLNRPIEEAPRDEWILVVPANGEHLPVFAWWKDEVNGWSVHPGLVIDPTHFLPLPKPGPVEFEVVPVGASHATIEHLREAAEHSYLRGIETGAEVQRLEDEGE